MVDDPNSPKPTGEAGGPQDQGPSEDPILEAEGAAQLSTPLYQDQRVFVCALIGLAAATVGVYYFDPNSFLPSILLAATLSFGITGLLGGRGYFKNKVGSVGGAAAILLVLFSAFEAARYLDNAKEAETAKENLASKVDEVTILTGQNTDLTTAATGLKATLVGKGAEITGLTSDLEKAVNKNIEFEKRITLIAGELLEAQSQITAFQNLATSLEIMVYCREAPHTQKIFLVSKPRDPFSNLLQEPKGMPALIELTGNNSQTIYLHVAGYRPPGFITPAQTRYGRSGDRRILPQTDPAFTVHTRWGVFESEAGQLRKTEIRIEVHDYNAFQRCDDKEVAGR